MLSTGHKPTKTSQVFCVDVFGPLHIKSDLAAGPEREKCPAPAAYAEVIGEDRGVSFMPPPPSTLPSLLGGETIPPPHWFSYF